jgi:hypothetical protein
MALNSTYWLPQLNGRLYIEAATAVRVTAKSKIINLGITARGGPSNSSIQGILEWLDRGHYFVTNTFKDITSGQMHAEWSIEK